MYNHEEQKYGKQTQHGRPWEVRNAWERDPHSKGLHLRPVGVESHEDTTLWATRVIGEALAGKMLKMAHTTTS